MAVLFDYTRARATAERLIDRFGQTGAVRRATGGAGGDPWNPGSQTGGSSSDHAVRLVVLDYEESERANSQIAQTDRRAYVSTAGLTIEITSADALVVAGAPLAIKAARPLNPGGTTLLYDLQVGQ